jgi:hypothetical protein
MRCYVTAVSLSKGFPENSVTNRHIQGVSSHRTDPGSGGPCQVAGGRWCEVLDECAYTYPVAPVSSQGPMTPEAQLSLAGVTHPAFFRAVPQTNLAAGKSP